MWASLRASCAQLCYEVQGSAHSLQQDSWDMPRTWCTGKGAVGFATTSLLSRGHVTY